MQRTVSCLALSSTELSLSLHGCSTRHGCVVVGRTALYGRQRGVYRRKLTEAVCWSAAIDGPPLSLLQTFLTFAPDGCEYGEAEPVLLCDGCMRNTAGGAGERGGKGETGGGGGGGGGKGGDRGVVGGLTGRRYGVRGRGQVLALVALHACHAVALSFALPSRGCGPFT